MKYLLPFIYACFTAAQVSAQLTDAKESNQPGSWKVQNVSLGINLSPHASQNILGNSALHELPIGRLQPGLSFTREANADAWYELGLYALRPNLSTHVLDTMTQINAVGKPELLGTSGSMQVFHLAVGGVRGKVSEMRILRCKTFYEIGAMLGVRNRNFSASKELVASAIDFKSRAYYFGILAAIGIRIVDRPGFVLDMKSQNLGTLSSQKTKSVVPSSHLVETNLVMLNPVIQVRFPLRN